MGERDGQAGVRSDAGDQAVAAGADPAVRAASERLAAAAVVAPVNSAPCLPIES